MLICRKKYDLWPPDSDFFEPASSVYYWNCTLGQLHIGLTSGGAAVVDAALG